MENSQIELLLNQLDKSVMFIKKMIEIDEIDEVIRAVIQKQSILTKLEQVIKLSKNPDLSNYKELIDKIEEVDRKNIENLSTEKTKTYNNIKSYQKEVKLLTAYFKNPVPPRGNIIDISDDEDITLL